MGRAGRYVAFGLGRKRRPPGFAASSKRLRLTPAGRPPYPRPGRPHEAGLRCSRRTMPASPRPFNFPHRVSDANFYARGTALSRLMRTACRMRPRRLTPNARHRARCDQGHDVGCCSRAYRASMTGVTHRQRRKCSVHGTEGQAVDMGRAGLELVTGAEIFQTYTFLPDAAGRLPAAFSFSIGMKKRPPFRRAFSSESRLR